MTAIHPKAAGRVKSSSMKFLVGLVTFSIAVPVLSDTVQCASDSGIRCENTAIEAAQDYRCVTQATMEFRKDLSSPSDISETFNVTFRVFYAGERWNVGPDSISRVVN